MPETTLPHLLSIREAAEYLGVSKDTLRRWEREGKINPFRTPGNQRRYSAALLDEILSQQGESWVREEPAEGKPPLPSSAEEEEKSLPGDTIPEAAAAVGQEEKPAWEEAVEETNRPEPTEEIGEEESDWASEPTAYQQEDDIALDTLEQSLEESLMKAQQLKEQLVGQVSEAAAEIEPAETSKTRLQRFYQPRNNFWPNFRAAAASKLALGIAAAIISLALLTAAVLLVKNYGLPSMAPAELLSPIPVD